MAIKKKHLNSSAMAQNTKSLNEKTLAKAIMIVLKGQI